MLSRLAGVSGVISMNSSRVSPGRRIEHVVGLDRDRAAAVLLLRDLPEILVVVEHLRVGHVVGWHISATWMLEQVLRDSEDAR